MKNCMFAFFCLIAFVTGIQAQNTQEVKANGTTTQVTFYSPEIVRVVKFPSDAKFGVILKTDMFDRNGKLLDSAQEYCCITDFAPRDASFGITNANLLYTKGMAEVQNSGFKKRYVGAYEYYCWAKSVVYKPSVYRA